MDHSAGGAFLSCFNDKTADRAVLTMCVPSVMLLYIHKEPPKMAVTQTPPATGRGETLNLRATRKQKALIDQAAEALGRSRSDFMLDIACREAESVLLDRRYFSLSA